MLLDEAVEHDPEQFSPDLANSVHAPVGGVIEGLVGCRVDCFVLEIRSEMGKETQTENEAT
jgi:hypothetical protein